MDSKEPPAEIRRSLLLALSLAVLWALLAIARTGVTYHLAPLLVAVVPGLAAGVELSAGRRVAARLAAMGLGGALAVTALLSVLGRLGGPSVLPFGGAATEAVLFAFLGGGAAWAFGYQMARTGRAAS